MIANRSQCHCLMAWDKIQTSGLLCLVYTGSKLNSATFSIVFQTFNCSFISNPMRFRSRSIDIILTSMTSPTVRFVPVEFLNDAANRRYSRRSTKAPKSTIFRLYPLMHSLERSFIERISFRKIGLGMSSRGSLPGRPSSSKISRRVGKPVFNRC